MKKFDINTRQGRARRSNASHLFNPETLQPHNKKHREMLKAAKPQKKRFTI